MKFNVSILPQTGSFEIFESGDLVLTGRIAHLNREKMLQIPALQKEHINQDTQYLRLNANDIYKELILRGYDYSGIFRGLIDANNLGME